MTPMVVKRWLSKRGYDTRGGKCKDGTTSLARNQYLSSGPVQSIPLPVKPALRNGKSHPQEGPWESGVREGGKEATTDIPIPANDCVESLIKCSHRGGRAQNEIQLSYLAFNLSRARFTTAVDRFPTIGKSVKYVLAIEKSTAKKH